MTDLVLSAQIEVAPGTWVELEDAANGYEIGAGSFADRTLTAKQQTIGEDATWLRGSLVIASAPGNVTETLEVWVTADDQHTFDTRVNALLFALTEQTTFKFRRTVGNSRQTWTCFASTQVRIVTQREYLFAVQGLVSAQVTRLPDILLESV